MLLMVLRLGVSDPPRVGRNMKEKQWSRASSATECVHPQDGFRVHPCRLQLRMQTLQVWIACVVLGVVKVQGLALT